MASRLGKQVSWGRVRINSKLTRPELGKSILNMNLFRAIQTQTPINETAFKPTKQEYLQKLYSIVDNLQHQ